MTAPLNRPNHPLLHLLPESVIQLSIEVQKYHPQLFLNCVGLRNAGMVEMLSILAAEVKIVVDGMFDDTGVDALAEAIRLRLVARRTVEVKEVSQIVLPPGFTK